MRTILKITETSRQKIGRCLERTEYQIESSNFIHSGILHALRDNGLLGSGQVFREIRREEKPQLVDGQYVYILNVARECDSSG